MSEGKEELAIRRILIGLDTSYHSLAALRAAAELASSLEAELHGLFVEDSNLLRAAELTVARELRFPFATRGRLSPIRMRRQLRAQAEQARQALSAIARHHEITWSFQVVRGAVSAKMLEEAANADLLCVGRASRPVLHRSRVGSTAEAAAMRGPRSVLLVSRDTGIHPPVVVLYDGSPDTKRVLLLASNVADHIGGLLSILVPASASGTSKEIQEQITSGLDAEGLLVRYRELAGSGVMSLINAVQTEGAGMLVLERAFLPSDSLRKLLDEVDCPVLLVG